MPQRFDNFFHAVTGNEGDLCHYSTRLDTYGCGCQHNCGYCYARSLLDFRGLWNPVAPSAASVRDIYKVVKNKLRPGDVVRLGGMTDCFQPMEAARKNASPPSKPLPPPGTTPPCAFPRTSRTSWIWPASTPSVATRCWWSSCA